MKCGTGRSDYNRGIGGVAESRKMPGKRIDFATVRDIALAMPGVVESTAYGARALKVRGKLLACVPVNRSAEADSLMIRVDPADRDELVTAAPDVYYVTEHYAGYNAVLVRLARVDRDALTDLLGLAYKFVTRKAGSKRSL